MKTAEILLLCGLLAACGDSGDQTDGGQDATTNDAPNDNAVKDVATDASADVAADAPLEASSDAGADVATDAKADAIVDAAVDAPFDAAIGCDGGCTTYSVECKSAQPACQCVGLAFGEPPPVCDAGAANCFMDPCNGKTAKCVNNVCVVQ